MTAETKVGRIFVPPPRNHNNPPDEPLLVRPARAFAMLGVGKTKGFELIAKGVLEAVKLGPRCTGVTMASIRRLAEKGIATP
jgi:hypothetical protein